MHRSFAGAFFFSALLSACSSARAGGDASHPDAATPADAADAALQDAQPDPDGGALLPACSGATAPRQTHTYVEPSGGGAPSAAQQLDLHLPSAGTACPLLVWVHGGGWQSGSRALGPGIREVLSRQMQRGFAVASIDYRLSGEAQFPAQINDVKAAIRWLRAHASEHRIDPDRIALMGASAGGHLATLAGTSAGVTDLEDPQLGNSSQSTAVRGVIDCYGPIDLGAMDAQLLAGGVCGPGSARHGRPDSPESLLLGCTTTGLAGCPEAVARANPLTYFDGADPPMLIGHGTNDCTVPIAQSRDLDTALRGAGVSSELHVVEAGTHEIPSCPPATAIDAFLDRVLRVQR